MTYSPLHLRFGRWLLSGALLACVAASAQTAQVRTAADPGYTHFWIGDSAAPTPDPVEPGMLLNGGGEWPLDAFRWFVARAGHGHIVILRASQGAELQESFYKEIGGIVSAETFVFNNRRAASDPAVLAAIGTADGIFLSGGDQSNYVRYWKGTPLNVALDRHVREGKPIGGTSAGLAILGTWEYGAMDGGSITASEALSDPLGKAVTLVGDFLHLPFLEHVVTDTHFTARERLGRLIAFLAKLEHQGVTNLIGLGIDESASLCIDGDGIGRVYTRDVVGEGGHGYAWVVQPTRAPAPMVPGKPLTQEGVRLTGVGTGSRLHLRDFSVDAPAFHRIADVHDGRLEVREDTSLSAITR